LLLEAKRLKTIQRGSPGSSPLRLDGHCDGQAGGWTVYPVATQWLYYLKLKPRGIYQARVHSDLMVLMIVRPGGWTSCLVAKDAQMRVGNNSRQPRNLIKNRQSDSLK
jgi:hypothetical protein